MRDASGGLGIESGNRTEQGRLAASRRTKKADELSSVDFQGKFPNRDKLPKMLGEVLNFLSRAFELQTWKDKKTEPKTKSGSTEKMGLLGFRLGVVTILPLGKNTFTVNCRKFEIVVNHCFQDAFRKVFYRFCNSGIGDHSVALVV